MSQVIAFFGGILIAGLLVFTDYREWDWVFAAIVGALVVGVVGALFAGRDDRA